MMDEVNLKLSINAFARMREMVIAGGKFPATGENGLHSASQLIMLMDGQFQQQQEAAQKAAEQPPDKTSTATKANGVAEQPHDA